MSFNLKNELELIQNRVDALSEEAVSDFDSATTVANLDFTAMGAHALSLVAMAMSDHPAAEKEITDKAALKSLLIKAGEEMQRGYNEQVEAHFN